MTETVEAPEKIEFKCSACGMIEMCDYKGKAPPFIRNIAFTEEIYAMKDPFSPPPTGYESKKSLAEYLLVLGSDCTTCGRVVCKDCSFFYAKTYCLTCVAHQISEFPLEVQPKIRKLLSKA